MIFLQFADVYLFEKKNDLQPVKWKEIEVLFDSNMIQKTTPIFEVEISQDEEFERISSFNGELLRLKTIFLDDDEIPVGYIFYDITNWEFDGKRLIVQNPNENVYKYTLPFKSNTLIQ